MYTAEVQVGTPGISCHLIVDTGSSDMWVKASHKDLSQSRTAKTQNDVNVYMAYGRGQVDGVEMTDRVCLGSVCIGNQNLVLAKQVSVMGGKDSFFDGFLGLAFPALAKVPGGTYMEHLMQEQFEDLAIGLSLQLPSDGYISSSAGGGALTIGQVEDVLKDAEAVTGEHNGTKLNVVPVNGKPYWWLVSADVTIGKGGPFSKEGSLAMLDSGTSLIAVPPADFQDAIDALIPRPQGCSYQVPSFEGYLVCPCDTATNPLTFTFNDYDTGAPMSVSLGRDDLLVRTSVSDGAWGELCMVKMERSPPTEYGMQMWILGDPFLQKVYAVHDVRHRQIVLYPGVAAGGFWLFLALEPLAAWLALHGVDFYSDRTGIAAALWLLALLVCSYQCGRRHAQRVAPAGAGCDADCDRDSWYVRL